MSCQGCCWASCSELEAKQWKRALKRTRTYHDVLQALVDASAAAVYDADKLGDFFLARDAALVLLRSPKP